MKRALIIGVNGQDGSYLAELLLEKGYAVTGWVREHGRSSMHNLCEAGGRIALIEGDLRDPNCFYGALEQVQPDEVYNLAAPSRPYASWDDPVGASELAGVSVARLLEAVRSGCPQARFYQASSSEMFGIPLVEPQDETTPFNPRNPYGAAKTFAHTMVMNYRQYYGLYAVSGILFNHESPRRGFGFVTRKITLTAAAIKLGLADELRLGDLEARRDWGYAPDYVRAMWMMLQPDLPENYVIGTGITHSVREFCEAAFTALDLDYSEFVVQDPALLRPKEDRQLVANPSRAMRALGWEPSLGFAELVRNMVQSDLEFLKTTGEFSTMPVSCEELERLSLLQAN